MKDLVIGSKIKLSSYSDYAKVKCWDGTWELYKGNRSLSSIVNGQLRTFDDIEAFDYHLDYFKVRLGQEWRIINNQGEYVCFLDRCNKIEALRVVSQDIDSINKETITLDYFITHVTDPYDENLSYMGIYNSLGKVIYPPILTEISIKEDGDKLYCYVKNGNGEKSFVNLKSYYSAQKENKSFYYDIIKEKYEERNVFRVISKNEDKSLSFGFLDEDGYTIIPPVFDNISFVNVSGHFENFTCRYKTRFGLMGLFSNNNLHTIVDFERFVETEKEILSKKGMRDSKIKFYGIYKSAIKIPPIYQNIDNSGDFYRAFLKGSPNDLSTLELDIYYDNSKIEKILHYKNGDLYDCQMNKLFIEEFSYKGKMTHLDALKFNLNGRVGVISKSGIIIIPPSYDNIEILEERQGDLYFKVSNKNKYGIYGRGEQLYPPLYDEVTTDRLSYINREVNGCIIVEDGLYGIALYDRSFSQGTFIHPSYQSIICNEQQIFIVKQNGKYGAIALRDSQIQTQMIYDSMEFHYGRIYARLGRNLVVISNLASEDTKFETSELVKDLTKGYSDEDCEMFVTDCKKTNLLHKR